MALLLPALSLPALSLPALSLPSLSLPAPLPLQPNLARPAPSVFAPAFSAASPGSVIAPAAPWWEGLNFSQWGIKTLLLAAVVVVLVAVTREESARHMAIRRLATIFFGVVAIITIIFPQLLSHLAQVMGVGRGTDLLLYALIVVFFGSMVVQWRRNLILESKITQLTRTLALMEGQDQAQAQGQTGPQEPA